MVSIPDPTLTLAARGPLFDANKALVERLELAFPRRQFDHRAVPAKLSKAMFESLCTRTPFVAHSFQGLQPPATNSRTYRAAASWMVYVGIRNQHPGKLLTGDTGGVGVLGMAGLATALLHGWTVRGLGTWSVGAVTNAYSEDWLHDDLGLLAVDVSISLEVTDEEAAAALPEFLRVGATWDLPPIGEQTTSVRDP